MAFTIKYPNIQNHRVLAHRYRRMARAVLKNQEGKKAEGDNTYVQLIKMAEEHERVYAVLGRKRGQTFIFIRR